VVCSYNLSLFLAQYLLTKSQMSVKQSIIPIGSDHGGFRLKKYIIDQLSQQGFHFKDFGTFSEEGVDYPDFIHPVAVGVDRGDFEMGIVICGSGQGASMTANKYSNVRSALVWDIQQTALTRQHNDANIIAFPGRFIDFDLAVEMVKVFLNTPFEGARHLRRIEKIPVPENHNNDKN
jgi:ribose 5-phosphate isomerase B